MMESRKIKLLISSLAAVAFIILMSMSVTGCGSIGNEVVGSDNSFSDQEREEILVFAAASLTESFESIKEAYEVLHPEVEIIYNFAGSQVLSNQIKSGASPHMYFSANERYVDEVIATYNEKDREETREQNEEENHLAKISFASNALVILVGDEVEYSEFETLIEGLKSETYMPVVVASEDVPVGKYSKKMLDAYLEASGDQSGYNGFYSQIVSYESDVKAVLTKVKIHEADVSLVYSTDASSIDLRQHGLKVIEIPDEYNQEASYGSVLFSSKDYASQFYEFIISGQGKQILEAYGFK